MRAFVIWTTGVVIGLWVSACLVLLTMPVLAHEHARPELDDWYNHLGSKGGELCCNASEPIVVDDWESRNGHYRVFVRGGWQDVPDSAIVNVPNLAGRALVWQGYPKSASGPIVIRCFIPGTMT